MLTKLYFEEKTINIFVYLNLPIRFLKMCFVYRNKNILQFLGTKQRFNNIHT